jgi:hypothetical protein
MPSVTNLVIPALIWGAYAVGMLCSLFGYLYLRCKPLRYMQSLAQVLKWLLYYNASGQYTAPVIFAFLIGLRCCELLCEEAMISRVFSTVRWSFDHASLLRLFIKLLGVLYWYRGCRFVGIDEDPQTLAIRAPELFLMCNTADLLCRWLHQLIPVWRKEYPAFEFSSESRV